jgi:hypothetical protein
MFDALGRHSPVCLIEKNKIKFGFGNYVGFSPDKVKPNPSAKPSLSPACLRVMVTFSGCWFSTYHWKSGTVLIRPQILMKKEKHWIIRLCKRPFADCRLLGVVHEGRDGVVSMATSTEIGQSTVSVDFHGDHSTPAVLSHLKHFRKWVIKVYESSSINE